MRTLFIGGTRRGYDSLRALINAGVDVCGVISLRQDDHETERFEEPIAGLCRDHGIRHVVTKCMKDRDFTAIIREMAPEIALCIGCRILIPAAIYTIPRLGALAVHDSLLPKYRGFAPLNWAILNGESQTGATLFHLSEGTDEGDIVAQVEVPITFDDTAPMVADRVSVAAITMMLDAWDKLAAGAARRINQNHLRATYTCKRTPEDGEIDWRSNTRAIHNQVRALTHPYPGAFTFLGTEKLYVWRSRCIVDPPMYAGRTPGCVVALNGESVDVLTGDGVLSILEVGRSPDEIVAAASVLKSIRQKLGLRVSDLLATVQELRMEVAELRALHWQEADKIA